MISETRQDVSVIRRPVKHARLRVREDTSVELVVPISLNQPDIDNLLRTKRAWIARHQRFFRERAANSHVLKASEVFLFGEIFQCVVFPELGRNVVVCDDTKEIRTGRKFTLKTEVERWQRSYARTFLTARAAELSEAQRLPFKRLFIRSQRTKWGACSTRRNISLNWRLILMPKYVIDYVVIHELLHTKILNHGHSFWVHLRAICPKADEAIHWLKHKPVFPVI